MSHARQEVAADALVAAAKKQFLRTGQVDIQAAAAAIGVSRATAYRWVGNADALTGVVIADIAESTFRRAVAETAGSGPERIIEAMSRGMRLIVKSRPYRQFLERDPHKALRLAASKDGPAQARMVELHKELLDDEIARGNLALPVDTRTMAYALVRTAESFMYADLIAGEQPALDDAVAILRLLIR
jgi:AcrR family transcriptional regulator